MTSKQRILKTLTHRIPDKVPWSLLINDYFFHVHKDKYNKMDSTDFLKSVEADGVTWLGFHSTGNNLKVNIYIDGKLFKMQEGGNWFTDFYDYLFIDYYKGKDGRTVEREYITPVGKLNTKCIFKKKFK